MICAPAVAETLLLRKKFSVKPGLQRALVQLDVVADLVTADHVEQPLQRHALGVGFPGRSLDIRAVVADVSLEGLGRDAWHAWDRRRDLGVSGVGPRPCGRGPVRQRRRSSGMRWARIPKDCLVLEAELVEGAMDNRR